MAGKKKTVKDLNVDVINLAVKFKHFEETLVGMTLLKEFKDFDNKLLALDNNAENEKKIRYLEKEVHRLNTVVNDLKTQKEEEISKSIIECNVCKDKFSSKKDMKVHKNSVHRKEIKCKYCEETFDENFKLEIHLEKHVSKEYNCEHCDKSFHLEWRFEKHRMSHSIKTTRNCHYFNNCKLCPYEEIGCMFHHRKSVMCKHDKSCKVKLCSYQHKPEIFEKDKECQKNTTENSVTTVDSDEHDMNPDSDSDIEENECDTCGKVFETKNDLWDHESSDDNCGYGCDECGAYYREECHLKLHLERHCTKCFDEFSPKSNLEAHKKICIGITY